MTAERFSRRKRAALIVITVIVSALLVEAGSWTILSIKERRLFSPKRYQASRRQLLTADDESLTTVDRPEAPRSATSQADVLHPYLGFVERWPREPWGLAEPSPLRKRSPGSLI